MTLVLEMIFLDMTPKTQIAKAKSEKQDYVKLKNFYAAKRKSTE